MISIERFKTLVENEDEQPFGSFRFSFLDFFFPEEKLSLKKFKYEGKINACFRGKINCIFGNPYSSLHKIEEKPSNGQSKKLKQIQIHILRFRNLQKQLHCL